MLNSTLTITSSNLDVITLPFDEMGRKIDEIIEEYITENEKNRLIYEKFKLKYNSFSPNLDFLLTKLEYELVFPFDDEIILTGLGNELIDKNTLKSRYKTIYPLITDDNLNIHKLGVDNIETGMIGPKAIMYSASLKDLTHLQICELLGLHMMLYDKKTYVNYLKNKDKYFDMLNFFLNELGYIRVAMYTKEEGIIVYNSSKIDEYMRCFLNSILEFYPNIILTDMNISKQEGEKVLCK